MDQFGGWAALRAELDRLAETMRNKPREHGALPILGELAAFASQWDPATRRTAREFASIARGWAANLDEEVDSPSAALERRARRCIFYMYSMICSFAGELSPFDVDVLCQGSILAEYNRLFEDPTSLDQDVRTLSVVSCVAMTRRLPEVLCMLDDNPQQLTAAVKLVLDETPDNLRWHRVLEGEMMTTCFEAVACVGPSGRETLFSVNVQTGVLLFDGLPPERLPAPWIAMPLYRRTFGDRNFEIRRSSDGVLSTLRRVGGCFYSFFVNATGDLVVHETDHQGCVLELLNGTASGVTTWGSELPMRLQKMHSHWWSRSEQVVILRPRLFYECATHFMLRLNADDDPMWECLRVPHHLTKHNWTDLRSLADTFDALVLLTSPEQCPALQTLQKFESDAGLVHTLIAPSGMFIFELPRYDLHFELVADGTVDDGTLRSTDFRGFLLSRQQLFHDALLGFEQYLLLKSTLGDRCKVLMPTGEVITSSDQIAVNGPSSCDADRRWHAYDVHSRFGTLDAAAGPLAVEARRQLAAVYAASGSEIPESRSRMTGGEFALELLRQSRTNKPSTMGEHAHLSAIAKHYSTRMPALPLLCFELDLSARELAFLHLGVSLQPELPLDIDAAAEYKQRKKVAQLNPRAVLTADEEKRVIAVQASVRRQGRNPPRVGSLEVPSVHGLLDSCTMVINEVETRLREMIEWSNPKPASPLQCPIKRSDWQQETELARHAIMNLVESWEAYISSPTNRLLVDMVSLEAEMVPMRARLHEVRHALEAQMLSSITFVPEDICWHAFAFIMRRAANLEPYVTPRDLMRAALEPNELRRFNPFLSNAAINDIHSAILEWLQACVLEDKLERMACAARQQISQEIALELANIGRKWSAQEHPEWLVFEVEQRLQIRHVQYTIAQFLMEHPGTATQLNMGEGKTRVIIPMLLLSCAHPKCLMRLHFLSPLLGEAYDYLHRTITASVFCRPVGLMPFHRDIKPSLNDAETLLYALLRYKTSLGALCVSPEHRLSLKLKLQELWEAGCETHLPIREMLSAVESGEYSDVLDECDEMLRQVYQLIYALGNCCQLPGGTERFVAAQAVLKTLQCDPTVAAVLRNPDVARRVPHETARGVGSFDDLRLLAGQALDDHTDELLQGLAEGIMKNPPYHMSWLSSLNEPLKASVLSFVTNPLWTTTELAQNEGLSELHISQLHALRGLLARDIMKHGLCRRHRVDYGTDPRRANGHHSTRMAVPFHACDRPKERAEFAQPDMQIILTVLSYYHDGLSRAQLKEALVMLQTLGTNSFSYEYKLWLRSAWSSMTDEQKQALDNTSKWVSPPPLPSTCAPVKFYALTMQSHRSSPAHRLDHTCDVMLELLHSAYRYNMAAIDFWLNKCVLPRETMQFPHRLVANAFDLADNASGQIMGFSGTKDTSLLLPFQVTQRTPQDASVASTDGLMLDLVGQRNREVVCLGKSASRLAILTLAVQERDIDAFIDAGATMAGLSNREVAEHVLALLADVKNSKHQGVVYFSLEDDAWQFLSRSCRTYPLGSSPIREKDAFVFFDQSHCRGADMKLREDAIAFLTVGQDMCKETIMQAAMRMRRLKFDQKLLLGVPAELVSKIQVLNNLETTDELQSEHVLQWATYNTVLAVRNGLSEYASQASHFITTQHPKTKRIDETLELHVLYGGSVSEATVFDTVSDILERAVHRMEGLGVNADQICRRQVECVREHARRYGADVRTTTTGLDEECERQLETERELEREVELQIPRQTPAPQTAWDFTALLRASRLEDLPNDAGVAPIADALAPHLAANLQAIDWAKSGMFLTRNYVDTVTAPGRGGTADGEAPCIDLSQYLRPVDALVRFGSETCLLLSEWEADQVLPLMRTAQRKGLLSSHVQFVNMAYLVQSADSDVDLTPPLQVAGAEGCFTAREHMIAGLQLFAGETMFKTPSRKEALHELLADPRAKTCALLLPEWRGRGHEISHSDLEAVCCSNILKANTSHAID